MIDILIAALTSGTEIADKHIKETYENLIREGKL